LGKGELHSQLDALAHNLGIAEITYFCGQVNNVEEYLACSDIFVLPSRAEGISNALLEAMACGLPCIATRIDGNRHVLTNAYNGLLVAPDDADELAQAIIRLGQDRMLRERLGQHARQTIIANYALDSVADRYVALYKCLLGA
jgi:glycosyltransferase involved in cell wall biosynthesis